MEGVTKEEQNKLYDETVFADTSENCPKTSTKYKERLIEVQKTIKMHQLCFQKCGIFTPLYRLIFVRTDVT